MNIIPHTLTEAQSAGIQLAEGIAGMIRTAEEKCLWIASAIGESWLAELPTAPAAETPATEAIEEAAKSQDSLSAAHSYERGPEQHGKTVR